MSRGSYLNTAESSASFFSTDKTPEEREREGHKVLSGNHQELVGGSGTSIVGRNSSSQLAGSSISMPPASPLSFEQKG
jgi:hypothetical protein